MFARLGQVLYWAACGIAALLFASGIYIAFGDAADKFAIVGFTWAFAGSAWLVGRAALYVLSGK